jgi:hypothetical protein
MSLSRALMDATDAMAEADARILEALAAGALVDAPAEVSLALLHFGIAARNLCDAILAHYAPQIGEPHDNRCSQIRFPA